MKQNILIVDDEISIVTLLAFNIEQAGYLTDTANTGSQALRKAMKNNYDMIILDVMIPEINGMEVCKHLRDSGNNTPILMLTAKGDEDDKILGLNLGADDYLTKPFSPKEVIARINAILRRINSGKMNMNEALKIGDLVIYPDKHEVEIDQRSPSFTRKEFELLLYLARHKGKVLSRDQLLYKVWDYEFTGDTRIVDVHISRLREKIEPDTKKPEYITTIRGLGYKMEEFSS